MTDREKLAELLCQATFGVNKQTIPSYLPPYAIAEVADHLIAHGVTFAKDTNALNRWIPASEPPEEYRDEYGELIPFLVCVDETEYPFRAMYDGKKWGDGLFEITAKWWMPLPEPPKGE